MGILKIIIVVLAVIVLVIVLLFIILGVVFFMGKWQDKGVNPMKKFPRNPRGRALTMEEQRGLNAGAILAEVNIDYCDSLVTGKAAAKDEIKRLLSNEWGIHNAKDAAEALEDLKNNGHRAMFNILLKNSLELLKTENSAMNYHYVYNQTGFSLLDNQTWKNCQDEISLLEQYIKKLLNLTAVQEILTYRSAFDDDETFGKCIYIFQKLTEQWDKYIYHANHLKKFLPQLKNHGIVGEPEVLTILDATAWDMGRMVNIARYCYDCGYLTESKAWEYILHAGRVSESCYIRWEDFGKAYVIGRAIWGGENINMYTTMTTYESLKDHKDSPWKMAPLKKFFFELQAD